MKMRNLFLLLSALAVGVMDVHIAHAQSIYPDRAVSLVVPTAPGGAWDIMGRFIAERLAKLTGKTFVVENRAGAGTMIGAQAVARAAPDGYTLLIAGTATLALAPALSKVASYDPSRDFIPVSLISTHSYTLIGRPGLPASNLQELIALGKQGHGLTVATSGRGSGQHVAALLLAEKTGMQLTYVPYKGAGEVYPDLMSGRVDLYFDTTSVAAKQIVAGKVKAFIVSSPERSVLIPAVPTAHEAGLTDFAMEGWLGVFAPTGVATERLELLRGAIETVKSAPEFKNLVEQAGGRVISLTEGERSEFIGKEVREWGTVIRNAGIQPE